MRYELSDYEWTAIKPMLPNKPRGIRRVNDRRVLNGIFWVLARGPDQQASRGGGRQRPAGSSRPVRLMTIDCVRSSSAPCFHKRYYSQIADMMRTGSGSLPVSKEHRQTFRRNEIAKTRSASARICIELRNLIERFFNKIKQCRRIATRYDKLAVNYLAFIKKVASIRIWLRANESTP
jgi:transposase